MSSESNRLASILDLQGFIQSIASQRRTGELVVNANRQMRRLRFHQGQIVAYCGSSVALVARSFLWAGILSRDRLTPVLDAVRPDEGPDILVQGLMERLQVSVDGVLDAFDCLVEEEIVTALSWKDPEVVFIERPAPDPWADLQARLGVSIAPSSLLLEAVRRQDELAKVAAILPQPWDALVTDNGAVDPAQLTDDARFLLAGWREGTIAGSLLDHPILPPFRAAMGVADLLRSGRVRTSSAAELAVQAEAATTAGQRKLALGLYRRAVALGQDTPRIQFHIADLAESLGDQAVAAEACIAAARQIPDQAAAAAALHRAIALGAVAEQPLRQLVDLHFALGEREQATRALLDLASWYEVATQWEQAIRCLREAQEFDADAAETGRHLARLFTAQGDAEQASLQLELAARAYHETDRLDEAIACWQELVRRHPGRCDFAKECAELLLWKGRRDEALLVLRPALAQRENCSEDLLVAVYALLAKLDPSDIQAHDWLAKSYERRRDRRGATEQLRLSAAALEKSGDDTALAATLERILELDPHQVEELARLAKVRLRLHQDSVAATLFLRACDEAVNHGQRREARTLLESAVTRLGWNHHLHGKLALAALRDGDRLVALRHALAAASIAQGCGDDAFARDMLIQASRLKPDDLLIKVRLAEAAEIVNDEDLDRIQAEMVRAAVRSANHGLALDFARRRILRHPTIEARSELMELLRRAGDDAGELAAGQELLADVLKEGRFDLAAEILSRLVASHPKDADLALQLAEAHNSLGDQRTALRLYRHALALLQADDRLQDAKDVLEMIAEQSDEPEVVAAIRERLAQGQAVDWERVRLELAQRRRVLERVASDTNHRPTTDRRRLPVGQRTPVPEEGV